MPAAPPLAITFRSAPAQNTGPLPVITTASTSASPSSSSKAWSSASESSGLMALRASGRFSVRISVRPRRSRCRTIAAVPCSFTVAVGRPPARYPEVWSLVGLAGLPRPAACSVSVDVGLVGDVVEVTVVVRSQHADRHERERQQDRGPGGRDAQAGLVGDRALQDAADRVERAEQHHERAHDATAQLGRRAQLGDGREAREAAEVEGDRRRRS